MTPQTRDELMLFARQLSKVAAEAILPYFRAHTPVEVKEGAVWDPVTEGDRAGERAIRQLIEKHYPSHGIVGEEYGVKTGTSDLKWILDPVDGTRAFVIGLPTWANLIGLYDGDKPILGVMSQPFVGDTFFGHQGGAWLDHRSHVEAIRVSTCETLSNAYVGTTSPHLYKDKNEEGLNRLRTSCRHMRYGGDAYFFSLLAAGHLDIAMDPTLQIYDIAALIPIIQGAGGIVGTWTTNDPTKGGNVLTAATQKLFDQAFEKMNK
jgi:myo-inositol-1(or 4)-monophosphatase